MYSCISPSPHNIKIYQSTVVNVLNLYLLVYGRGNFARSGNKVGLLKKKSDLFRFELVLMLDCISLNGLLLSLKLRLLNDHNVGQQCADDAFLTATQVYDTHLTYWQLMQTITYTTSIHIFMHQSMLCPVWEEQLYRSLCTSQCDGPLYLYLY